MGAIIVHPRSTRDVVLQLLANRSLDEPVPHNGTVSPFLLDQLGSSSAVVNASLQSGKLFEIVADPNTLSKLKDGTLELLRHTRDGSLMSAVRDAASKDIVKQIGFTPAALRSIVTPLAAWQILHAVAGVAHLQKINARLDALQRRVDSLTFRLQAKTIGQVSAAISTLQELSEQIRITGSFSSDMVVRLALADRDVQTALGEQHTLVQRFADMTNQVISRKGGVASAKAATTLLDEEGNVYMRDAQTLVYAARASLLSTQAWLRHDLEHNPRNVTNRLNALRQEVGEAEQVCESLTAVDQLDSYAKNCAAEFSWLRREVLDRKLTSRIEERQVRSKAQAEQASREEYPIVLAWAEHDGTRRLIAPGTAESEA